jgi:tetratricopeptide (TPR) repeat protein
MGVFRYNTSSIGYQIKKNRRVLLGAAILSLAVLCLVAFFLFSSLFTRGGLSGHQVVSKTAISKLWAKSDFQAVYDASAKSLSALPTDAYYLVMSGFSAYYLALTQVNDEDKIQYLKLSVSNLRKALLYPIPATRHKIEYVLGKAYYHLGYYFLDESIYYLERVSHSGFKAKDTDEYLALAYAGLDENEKSLAYYQRCIDKEPVDGLYLAAASVLIKLERLDQAQNSLAKAISLSKDAAIEEKASFMLADIYMKKKDYSMAEKTYSDIIAKNDTQSDAYYQLGLIAEINGDVPKARSDWRKAVKIDPMNQAARAKLTNRSTAKEATK